MIAKNMLRYSVMRYHSQQNLNMISRTFSAAPILNRKTNPSLPNLATAKEVTKKTEIKRKAFSRLFDFVEHYGEKVLDKLLPEVAMKAVKTFSRGTKALLADMKEYSWVNHVLTETSNWQKACLTLSRRQLEIYLYLPGEMMRVTPVLIVSAFPFAQNVAFPLAMMFPNHLLSSHFYNENQQSMAYHGKIVGRQSHYRHVLRYLNSSIVTPKSGFEQILSTILHDKTTPNPAAILRLKSIFEEAAILHIKLLTAPHVKHLMRAHQVRGSILWIPRFRLQQHANLVHQIDLAIVREGGPDLLSLEELRRACHLRGLNVKDQDQAVMLKYLTEWLTVTSKLDYTSMSMLLHLPILLGYNHGSRIWD